MKTTTYWIDLERLPNHSSGTKATSYSYNYPLSDDRAKAVTQLLKIMHIDDPDYDFGPITDSKAKNIRKDLFKLGSQTEEAEEILKEFLKIKGILEESGILVLIGKHLVARHLLKRYLKQEVTIVDILDGLLKEISSYKKVLVAMDKTLRGRMDSTG